MAKVDPRDALFDRLFAAIDTLDDDTLEFMTDSFEDAQLLTTIVNVLTGQADQGEITGLLSYGFSLDEEGEDAPAEDPAPVSRGRGRAAEVEAAPVSRGRGRGAAVVEDIPEEDNSEDDVPAPTRGRGRGAVAEVEAPARGRGPGRPRVAEVEEAEVIEAPVRGRGRPPAAAVAAPVRGRGRG